MISGNRFIFTETLRCSSHDMGKTWWPIALYCISMTHLCKLNIHTNLLSVLKLLYAYKKLPYVLSMLPD